MPNGAHNAQCLNCRFMVNSEYCWRKVLEEAPVWSEDGRWCRRHDFVMPDIDGEVLCSDFDWAGSGPGLQEDERLRALEPGFLYRYCYATGEPAAKVASFQALQNLFSVFLEVLHHQREFALHPDRFAYGKFRRPV
ncbi:MAG TPA: hypothetical protein VFA07_16750 [Chthonomonadaceae bacterium]|nr:hypothetical protein [Chthonomonadaceae bacterium]